MEELILELKKQIIEVLNLEEMQPEDIDAEAPLFGTGSSTASSSKTPRRARRYSRA